MLTTDPGAVCPRASPTTARLASPTIAFRTLVLLFTVDVFILFIYALFYTLNGFFGNFVEKLMTQEISTQASELPPC